MVSGGYIYSNLYMSQSKNAEEFFLKLLSKYKPSRILEIGTFHGGLTIMLRDLLDMIGLQETIIRTYDTAEQKFLKPSVDERTEVCTKNLFNYDYNNFKDEESKEEIRSFVNLDGPTLVLCDGGCKKCEFKLIAPLIKEADVIMAHDYAPNREYFEEKMQNIIWDWMEIQDSDIQKTVEEHSLQNYMSEEAIKAAWLCKIKEKTLALLDN